MPLGLSLSCMLSVGKFCVGEFFLQHFRSWPQQAFPSWGYQHNLHLQKEPLWNAVRFLKPQCKDMLLTCLSPSSDIPRLGPLRTEKLECSIPWALLEERIVFSWFLQCLKLFFPSGAACGPTHGAYNRDQRPTQCGRREMSTSSSSPFWLPLFPRNKRLQRKHKWNLNLVRFAEPQGFAGSGTG